MRIFLAVYARPPHRDAAQQAVLRAEKHLTSAFPVQAQRVNSSSWQAPHGGVHLLAWTNEPDWTLSTTPAGATAVAGHHPGEPAHLDGAVAARPGCFALFQADADGIGAATSIAAADPVYYARTGDLVVVGNRALLVRLAAYGEVEYDVLALQSVARQGYFLSEETPFAGVRALPPASRLVARDRLTVTTEPLPKGTGRGGGEVADHLVRAVEPLLHSSDEVRVTLTGGRDSRLIAALLTGAGIPYRAFTSGFDDDPDVIVARRVAAALGVEHQVTPPPLTPDNELSVVHPADRVHTVLRVCEGMLSAYENITGDAPYSTVPRLGGHNGEILRGGFLSGMRETTPQAVRHRTQTLFLAQRALFTAEANAHAEQLAWTSDGLDVPDHLYVRFRVGRWHAAARTAMLRRGTPVQPFLDNRVVAAALALDPAFRRSERLVHRLVKSFAPAAAKVPLEGGTWRFRAESAWARLRRRARGAEAAEAPAKPWNWRAEPGIEIAKELEETIVSSAALGRIVDLDRVPALFDGGRLVKPGVAWQLYTVASLLGTDLTLPPPDARQRVLVQTKRRSATSQGV
ncbi:asparagine synthase-related protein [Nonomuraea longicatena]|uniref:Asparagine synthetase domain-containing protein n=1 Tax=Nonomuraea longicatena TaxID=83682 RepID=A0ABP3ZVF1_9ACTN